MSGVLFVPITYRVSLFLTTCPSHLSVVLERCGMLSLQKHSCVFYTSDLTSSHVKLLTQPTFSQLVSTINELTLSLFHKYTRIVWWLFQVLLSPWKTPIYPCSWWDHLCLMTYIYIYFFFPPKSFRISSEHSPKLQIRSHSYLRAVSEVSINRSLDSLDPAGLLTSPKFRSRNESYMRAMSTISQVGGHAWAAWTRSTKPWKSLISL